MSIVLFVLTCWLVLSIVCGALAAWGVFRFKRNTSRNPRPQHLIARLKKWKDAA